MTAPRPYIERSPGDRVRSADWNAVQLQAEEELWSHGHAPGSLSAGVIDPAASLSCQSLDAMDLSLRGQNLALREAEAVREAFGLPELLAGGVALERGEVQGPLSVRGLLAVAGDIEVGGAICSPVSGPPGGGARVLTFRDRAPNSWGGGILPDATGALRSYSADEEVSGARLTFSCAVRTLFTLRWAAAFSGSYLQIAPFFVVNGVAVPIAYSRARTEEGVPAPFHWSADEAIASTYGKYGGDTRFTPWQEVCGLFMGAGAQTLTLLISPGDYDLRFRVHAMQATLTGLEAEITLIDAPEEP